MFRNERKTKKQRGSEKAKRKKKRKARSPSRRRRHRIARKETLSPRHAGEGGASGGCRMARRVKFMFHYKSPFFLVSSSP